MRYSLLAAGGRGASVVRRWGLALALLWVLPLVGCALPVSEHPLSDEQTSVIDERLIGGWQVIEQPEKHAVEKGAGENAQPQAAPPTPLSSRFAVGRKEGTENTLESAHLRIDEEVIKVSRTLIYATQLGSERYLSWRLQDEDQKEKQPEYLIMLYRVQGEDAVELSLLRHDVIGPAIEKGELPGKVKRRRNPPAGVDKPAYDSIRISATPEEMAAYLKQHSPGCFNTERTFQIRRIPVD